MLNTAVTLCVVIVIFALVFDFINGFHDSANAIATSVSTRVLTMSEAVIMSASFNFLGAFISTKVAKTIGSGLVSPTHISQTVIISALIGAILWDLLTWYFGIPSSSSHALVGGLIGAAIVYRSTFTVVCWSNFWEKIVMPLFASPLEGFFIGYFFMTLINWIFRMARPRTVSKIFSKAQIFSAAFMALNHGGNDAQKSMGIITMALMSGGFIQKFDVPIWVKIACALSMALGTSIGGSRIIKTVGTKMAKLAPVNGFAAETGAACVIMASTLIDAPVSTTQIISTSIMGVAASKRFSSVRWIIAKNILWAWIFTIPTCAIVSAVIQKVIMLIF